MRPASHKKRPGLITQIDTDTCDLCGDKLHRDFDGKYPRDCHKCCTELYEDNDCDPEYLIEEEE